MRNSSSLFIPIGAMVVLLAGGGCKTTESYEDRYGLSERFRSPTPPAFLNGPVSLLLTNIPLFSCHAAIQAGTGSVQTGTLFGRDGRLLFALEPDKETGKRLRQGGFSFIWDARENQGFALSEPLQGVAPLLPLHTFTNVTVQPATGSPSQKIEGFLCEPENVTISAADGSVFVYEVWRARDGNNFPMLINSGGGAAPMSIHFTKVHFQAPPVEAFVPPETFTKYPTPENLAAEYVARQQESRGLRRTPSTDTGSIPGISPK